MATMKRMLARAWPSTGKTSGKHQMSVDHVADDNIAYNCKVDEIRESEYPTLIGTTYLDHAGTTPYAKSAIESWTAELTTNLFGNPHSASAASQLSTRRIDDIRLKVLRFCTASPDDFDVVFVANATAAIKLVAEAFRDTDQGFWYGFHADAHTSLVGCREWAERGSTCFQDDESLEAWIKAIQYQTRPLDTLQLVAYPGQSNMTGYRSPLRYCEQIRQEAKDSGRSIFTLLDAASLMSTGPLDLGDPSTTPDFIVLSFYKIFGFPDLGALIVRKQSAEVLMQKRYFAGGTVDGVALTEGGWHVKKPTLHASLEEGTLPFHNILALDHAMNAHARLFGSMKDVSAHSQHLALEAKQFLRGTRHANGQSICEIYGGLSDGTYGPIVSFNLKDSLGNVISASEVEKLCIVKGIQLRTGGLCNPGGVARHLDLSTEQIKANYNAGRRCGGESELINGKPTGAIRISFGAMSTKADLHNFIGFINEYYVEQETLRLPEVYHRGPKRSPYVIENLSVYPIKSCGAFDIPPDQRWHITEKGLAWDREWCLVHEGTKAALSQKRYPQMTLLQPILDLVQRKLRISYSRGQLKESIELDLDETPATLTSAQTCATDVFRTQNSKVCGDIIPVYVYSSAAVNGFFSRVLGVPCCLARYPRDTEYHRDVSIRKPTGQDLNAGVARQPRLMLSNESPILVVSTSSVNELNKQIQQNAAPANNPLEISASSFRANIVVSQPFTSHQESPYAEDSWKSLSIISQTLGLSQHKVTYQERKLTHISDSQSEDSITNSIPGSFSTADIDTNSDTNPTRVSSISPVDYPHIKLDILGPCQRCQMLTINQATAVSQQEPYSTLAKTRRKGDGRVWFGVHASLAGKLDTGLVTPEDIYVQIGDKVVPSIGC